jgi:selT/selW/selH-like putative selenoprotein
LAQALIAEYRPPIGTPHPIEELTLVPAGKGAYEISVDGRLVYSKLQTGKHISDAEAIKLVAWAPRP